MKKKNIKLGIVAIVISMLSLSAIANENYKLPDQELYKVKIDKELSRKKMLNNEKASINYQDFKILLNNGEEITIVHDNFAPQWKKNSFRNTMNFEKENKKGERVVNVEFLEYLPVKHRNTVVTLKEGDPVKVTITGEAAIKWCEDVSTATNYVPNDNAECSLVISFEKTKE